MTAFGEKGMWMKKLSLSIVAMNYGVVDTNYEAHM